MIDIASISKVGFGTYRMQDNDPGHQAALQYALEQGCTLIDTSSNYQNGRSEKLVGKVLAASGNPPVFIISKAGYVQEDDMPRLQQWREEGKVKYLMEIGEQALYCLDVFFLQDQLQQSLQRLQRNYIDAYLLHNPEYYLRAGSAFGSYFDEIIKNAFAFLEEQVRRGVIRYYGVSSNSFALPASHAQYIALQRLLNIAQQVSTAHHFKILQFPFNLGEQGAVQTLYNGESVPELCRRHHITTFANRPLNIDYAGNALQIGLQPASFDGLDAAKDNQLWSTLKQILAERLKAMDAGSAPDDFEVVRFLQENWMGLGNTSAASRLFGGYFAPFLDALYEGDHRQNMPAEDYAVLSQWFEVMKKYAVQQQYHKTAQFIEDKVKEGKLNAADLHNLPLNVCNKYLDAGISHVLMGMRKKEYVDSMKALF